jgi:methionyl-tRNA formyltransferase
MPEAQAPTRPRRFAITATDRYLGVFEAFVQNGWEAVKLFTVPADDRTNSNKAVIARAQELKIDIQLSRLDEAALAGLAARGCELLVVASYNWRIGPWQDYIARAVNFHPSPLPRYRGPYPLVRAILDREPIWGASCHKLSAEFDRGDILAQQLFETAPDESHDSLDLKTQMATQRVAHEVARDFDALWSTAQPQGEGSYVGLWSDADRTLDFNRTAEEISLQLRAFGNYECLAGINGVVAHVSRATAWRQAHESRPGSVVHRNGQTLVVACRDGMVAVQEWHLLAPGSAIGTVRVR